MGARFSSSSWAGVRQPHGKNTIPPSTSIGLKSVSQLPSWPEKPHTEHCLEEWAKQQMHDNRVSLEWVHPIGSLGWWCTIQSTSQSTQFKGWPRPKGMVKREGGQPKLKCKASECRGLPDVCTWGVGGYIKKGWCLPPPPKPECPTKSFKFLQSYHSLICIDCEFWGVLWSDGPQNIHKNTCELSSLGACDGAKFCIKICKICASAMERMFFFLMTYVNYHLLEISLPTVGIDLFTVESFCLAQSVEVLIRNTIPL